MPDRDVRDDENVDAADAVEAAVCSSTDLFTAARFTAHCTFHSVLCMVRQHARMHASNRLQPYAEVSAPDCPGTFRCYCCSKLGREIYCHTGCPFWRGQMNEEEFAKFLGTFVQAGVAAAGAGLAAPRAGARLPCNPARGNPCVHMVCPAKRDRACQMR